MKNITLSADERLIELARQKARSEHSTLNSRFREWLETYAKEELRDGKKLDGLFDRLKRDTGVPFTRDELNERQ